MALSAGLIPSLVIGACAFGAGELVFKTTENKVEGQTNENITEVLKEAKVKNEQIRDMISKVESISLQNNIKEINESVTKIIKTLEKDKSKYRKMNNFFDYYLPVTLNILKKYDEIENQRLTSEDGKNFMKQTENMIGKINNAFKNQLANLYQSDIVDTDAEMKVFETMLKADGYDTSNDFKKNNKEV